jgi:SAM-dependent methyltransferase
LLRRRAGPEEELGLLGDVRGLDVLELGCGTAYWSAWLQRRGARPIGLDLTSAQLATFPSSPAGRRVDGR